MIKKFALWGLNLLAKYRLKKMATFEGDNHLFYHTANFSHRDGANKNNILIKNGAWALGTILVEGKGTVIMHEYSKIDGTTCIYCVNKVEIGPYSRIAHNTTICDNNNHPVNPEYRKRMAVTPMNDPMRLWKHSANAPIIIGSNCWIGANVRICKGVTIGDNSVIAACSVVTKSIPANCIAAGNPARVVKENIENINDCL